MMMPLDPGNQHTYSRAKSTYVSDDRRGIMSGKTVTRADLAESVFRKVGLSRTESAQLVETVIDEICNAIVRGESVKLSSFATFQVRAKNERIGRNPKTGEEVPITPRRVVTFRPSQMLREFVEKGGRGRAKT
jgi:integration host factor subunit alpha